MKTTDRLSPRAMRLGVQLLLRPVLNPAIPVPVQRRLIAAVSGASMLPRNTVVEKVTLGTRPADRVSIRGNSTVGSVLYLHGGGYTVGSPATHRPLAAHLAKAAGAEVYSLDYRLAPETAYPGAVDDVVAAYQALLADGVQPSTTVIAGDSAGGGLTMAALLRIRDAGMPLPAGAVLLSPWLDLTLDQLADRPDPMLQVSWLRKCAELYVGSKDVAGAITSELDPLTTDISRLPALLIHVGSDEILFNDSERLAEHARTAGIPVEYRVFDGLWHVVHLHAGLVAESTAAVGEAGRFIREVIQR
ncbi:alpha/beta hydrolase [Hoyosella subflava]|nr:alpha/beta hydrolase [Hoyosella subflava]